MYIGYTKFQVILNLQKQCIKKKYLSVNFSCNFIEPTFNSYQQKYKSLIPNWLCEKKNIEKQFILEFLFVNQMSSIHRSLSENLKFLPKKKTPLL